MKVCFLLRHGYYTRICVCVWRGYGCIFEGAKITKYLVLKMINFYWEILQFFFLTKEQVGEGRDLQLGGMPPMLQLVMVQLISYLHKKQVYIA